MVLLYIHKTSEVYMTIQRLAFITLCVPLFSVAKNQTFTADEVARYAAEGMPLSYAAGKKDAGIILSVKDGALSFKGLSASSGASKKIKMAYKQVMRKKSSLSKMSAGRSINFGSGKDSVNAGSYHSAREEINLSAGQTMIIKSGILEAPIISLTGSVIDLTACCVIKSQSLQLKGIYGSAIKAINITFSQSPSVSCMLQGTIDMYAGTIEKEFIILGATEISIVVDQNEDLSA